MGGLFRKIGGSQQNGSVGLSLLSEKLTRCSLFNYFAQSHKLIYALIWPHVTPAFKIVHRRGTDCTQNYIALIEHRELDDRPIEVVTLDLTLLQRHCECSISGRLIYNPVGAACDVAYWHFPEVLPAAFDGRLRFQNGLWQAVQRRVYEFTP
jgi:hypothetical protein